MSGLRLGKVNHDFSKADMQKIAANFRAHTQILARMPQSMHSHLFWIKICLALTLYLSIDSAYADIVLFDPIQREAHDQAMLWLGSILGFARDLFKALAVFEIFWAAAIWALEKDNLSSLAMEMIQKIMFIGFFYALILNAHIWMPLILDSFVDIGRRATGNVGKPDITPDEIMSKGMNLITVIWAKCPSGFFDVIGSLGQIIVAVAVTLGVVITHVVIALQLLALNIESYVLLATGAILLGLGSTRWTSEYATKYLQYTLTLGVRLLVLLLILGFSRNVIITTELETFDYLPLLRVLAMVLMQAILAVKAPEMASALMMGGIGFSAGGAKSSLGSIAGGTSTAVGAAKSTLGTVARGSISGAMGAYNLGALAGASLASRGTSAAAGGASTAAKGAGAAASAGANSSNKGKGPSMPSSQSGSGASSGGSSSGGASSAGTSSGGTSSGGTSSGGASSGGASSGGASSGGSSSADSSTSAAGGSSSESSSTSAGGESSSTSSAEQKAGGGSSSASTGGLVAEFGRSAINTIRPGTLPWKKHEGVENRSSKAGPIHRAYMNKQGRELSKLKKGSS